MNRNIILVLVVVLVLAAGYFAYSNNQEKGAQRQTAAPLEDSGKDRAVYTGVTPCADCPGIDVKLSIKENGKYRMTSTYQERDVEPLIEKGVWAEEVKDIAGNAGATVLTLTSSDTKKTYFLVTQNGISQLDEKMQPVNNPYALNLEKKR